MTLNDRRFMSFLLDTTRNEVISMLDIQEPRSDKSRFHFLCLPIRCVKDLGLSWNFFLLKGFQFQFVTYAWNLLICFYLNLVRVFSKIVIHSKLGNNKHLFIHINLKSLIFISNTTSGVSSFVYLYNILEFSNKFTTFLAENRKK